MKNRGYDALEEVAISGDEAGKLRKSLDRRAGVAPPDLAMEADAALLVSLEIRALRFAVLHLAEVLDER